MTPLEEDELASEVRYLGMFPDLVDALLEAQEDADDKESKEMEQAAEAIAQVASLGATEEDILGMQGGKKEDPKTVKLPLPGFVEQ